MNDPAGEKKESKTKTKWAMTTYYGGKSSIALKYDPGYVEAVRYAERTYLDQMAYEKMLAGASPKSLNQLL